MTNKRLPIPRTEFKNATKEERYYYYLVYPDSYELTSRELEYLEKLKLAFTIMSNELSNKSSVKKIRKLLGNQTSERQIYNIMNDVRSIFGNIIETNKKFDRMVIRERLLNIAKRARKKGELEVERRCYYNIIKMEDLASYASENIRPEDVKLPELFITSDPNALNSENIDFEEI